MYFPRKREIENKENRKQANHNKHEVYNMLWSGDGCT